MKKISTVILVVCMSLLLNSCKEGCKDPRAINFASDASTENGTCLYCNDTMYTRRTTFLMKDNYNSGSGYYGQNVIEARVYNTTRSTSGNGCKSIGKTPQLTSSSTITLVNLTNKTIETRFYSYHYNITSTNDYYFSNYNFNSSGSYVYINPHDSISTYTPVSNTGIINLDEGSWQTTFNYLYFL